MLNEALRMIRVFHDKSQREVASALEISPSYLSEIEKGTKEPSLQILHRYSDELSIPLSSILFFSEHMDDGMPSNRTKTFVSGKVVALLKFIAARSGRNVEQD